jgi:RecA-family ATPase
VPASAPATPVPEAPDIDFDQLPPERIPDPSPDWPSDDLARYMAALYQPTEICAYVLDAYLDPDKAKWIPGSRGVYGRTVRDIVAAVRKHPEDIAAALGGFNPAAGAWCRLNPMDGKGVRNDNVTEFRHVLAESDTLPIDKQLAVIRALNLPCSAIVHSGGKSVHAIVKVDAGTDAKLFRDRVDFLFGVLDRNGFKVDRQCRNPSRLSRLPGIPRGDQKQYLISGPCGASSWSVWDTDLKADTDPMPSIRSIADYTLPKSDDPNELLTKRFLCRGGALLLVGPTGIGKSSFVMQAAFRWALAADFFGIQPARGLKVLVVQAENDDGDIAEIRDGVFRGLLASGQIMADDPDRVASRVSVVCEDSRTGRDFGAMLDRLLDRQRPDLLIIDPALAYLGGDALKQADVTLFCRNILNPIIHRHGVGLILVHHTNKPPKGEEKSDWKAGDLAYLGQGAADWANWARAVMAIRTLGSHSMFELCLGKRGGRVGWRTEKDGKALYTRTIAHSNVPDTICWREPSKEEAFAEIGDRQVKGAGRQPKDWGMAERQAVEIAAKCVHTGSQLRQEIMRTVIGLTNSAYNRQIMDAIKAAVDDGKLEQMKTHDGVKRVDLYGPKNGSVGKARDAILADRERRKQKELKA